MGIKQSQKKKSFSRQGESRKNQSRPKTRKAIKPEKFDSRTQIQNPKSKIQNRNGGDDRIRTCGSLLDYNGLANRRFQPLSHVSASFAEKQVLILADSATLSSRAASNRRNFAANGLTHLTLIVKISIVRVKSAVDINGANGFSTPKESPPNSGV